MWFPSWGASLLVPRHFYVHPPTNLEEDDILPIKLLILYQINQPVSNAIAPLKLELFTLKSVGIILVLSVFYYCAMLSTGLVTLFINDYVINAEAIISVPTVNQNAFSGLMNLLFTHLQGRYSSWFMLSSWPCFKDINNKCVLWWWWWCFMMMMMTMLIHLTFLYCPGSGSSPRWCGRLRPHTSLSSSHDTVNLSLYQSTSLTCLLSWNWKIPPFKELILVPTVTWSVWWYFFTNLMIYYRCWVQLSTCSKSCLVAAKLFSLMKVMTH